MEEYSLFAAFPMIVDDHFAGTVCLSVSDENTENLTLDARTAAFFVAGPHRSLVLRILSEALGLPALL